MEAEVQRSEQHQNRDILNNQLYFPSHIELLPLGSQYISSQAPLMQRRDFFEDISQLRNSLSQYSSFGTSQNNSFGLNQTIPVGYLANQTLQPYVKYFKIKTKKFFFFPLFPAELRNCFQQSNSNILNEFLVSSQKNIPQANLKESIKNDISKKIMDKYLIYRPSVSNFEEDLDLNQDQYVRISLFRQHSDTQLCNPYYLTKRGILGSNRNTSINDVMIGRQEQIVLNNQILFPNDIVMPQNETSISGFHCRIDTSEGFTFSEKMQSDFINFISVMKKKLPFVALNLIREFTKRKPQYFIVDLGTTAGTYIKVRCDKQRQIEEESTYMIGAEIQFHIVGMIEKFNKVPRNQEYLFETLCRLVSKGIHIHGLDQEEENQFQKFYQKKKKKLKTRKQFNLFNCGRPFLKIHLATTVLKNNSTHILIVHANQSQSFRIGRSQDCDIVIPMNTVSRKQTLITYNSNEQKWLILDGEDGRESANGTWESVQDYLSKQLSQKEETKKKLIENQMEVKIGETILKFENMNFNVRKKYQKNKILYLLKAKNKR